MAVSLNFVGFWARICSESLFRGGYAESMADIFEKYCGETRAGD